MHHHLIAIKILIIKNSNKMKGQTLNVNSAKLYLFWDGGSRRQFKNIKSPF